MCLVNIYLLDFNIIYDLMVVLQEKGLEVSIKDSTYGDSEYILC